MLRAINSLHTDCTHWRELHWLHRTALVAVEAAAYATDTLLLISFHDPFTTKEAAIIDVHRVPMKKKILRIFYNNSPERITDTATLFIELTDGSIMTYTLDDKSDRTSGTLSEFRVDGVPLQLTTPCPWIASTPFLDKVT